MTSSSISTIELILIIYYGENLFKVYLELWRLRLDLWWRFSNFYEYFSGEGSVIDLAYFGAADGEFD